MSQSSAPGISRTPTPGNGKIRSETTPSVTPRTFNQKKKSPTTLYLKIFLVFSLITLVIALLSTKPSNYCISDDEIFCKKCPKFSKCTNKDFECEEGYLKNYDQCLHTNLTDNELNDLHIRISAFLKNGERKVSSIATHFNIEQNDDLISAILYDNDFLIDSHNFVIKKPPALDPRFTWTLFLLAIALLLTSVEQYYYKKRFM